MRFLALAALAWVALAAEGAAAPGGPASRSDTPRASAPVEPPRLLLVRTDRPPRIDGVLDEPSWAEAALIERLTQVEPVEGARPTERTEIRLLYDRDFLYIGIRAFDAEPRQIVATQLERDGDLDSDDRIGLILDTFHDRRSAFFFQVNPRGARVDGLVEKSGRPKKEWDGIWRAKASIDDGGWTVEIAIPFKTLSFDPARTTWGFNVERVIRRTDEVLRWAAADQDRELTSVGDAGVLEGITGIEQGLGIDVKPSLAARYLRDRPGAREDAELKPALDVFYKITPSLTGVLTLNTDFAETEVDAREVNLTRFDLFFPEKRDFFLQDAGIFDFGGLERNGRPFFSRRIGLGPDGEVIDILAGAKVTGRVGGVNLGLLDVQTEAAPGLESKNLFVGRVAVNMLDQSSAGVIVTHGDPGSNDDNLLVGADFTYRTTSLFGDKTLTGVLWIQHSFSTGISDQQAAYGARLDYPNDEIEAGLGVTEIQKNFRPALGFVNRRNIRQYDAGFRYRFRPGRVIRRVDSGVAATVVTDLDTRVETVEGTLDAVRLRNGAGDTAKLALIAGYERLDEPFRIRGQSVTIPAGEYRADRIAVGLQTADSRPLRATLDVSVGEFFTGDRTELKSALEWRPSPFLFVALEYEQNDVRVPQGAFTTRVARARLNVRLSPDVAWTNFIQYDDVSDSMGINSRLQWILQPGNEIFLVLNQGFDAGDGRLRATVTEGVIKVDWTFRF